MTDKTWHTGGCHCGAVRFSVRLPKQLEIGICNCSICHMSGFEQVIVPSGDFRLEAGEDALATYRFNTGAAKHLFCRTCGIKSFYVPRSHPKGISVNFRCVDNPERFAVTRRHFDGVHWEESIAALHRDIPPED